MTEPARDRIVVGVDGSEPSLSALRWAVEQARLVGAGIDAGIDAVICWQHPAAYGWETFDIATDFASMARGRLEDAIKQVPHDGVDVRQQVLEGPAPLVLLEASLGARLLVVGSRGHGGFSGMLLGSVSQHCVQHASCPVVVVRGARDVAHHPAA